MAAAKTPEGLAAERERYAKMWSAVDAASFETQGLYDWMASHVYGHSSVFEVGVGDGSGTAALLRAGHVVVGVDENPSCLRMARARLTAAGHAVEVVERGAVQPGVQCYSVSYAPIVKPMPGTGALLVEGDTLNDPGLFTWLATIPPFDAVVCWLLGSHRARTFNSALEPDEACEYRLRVQNSVYVFSERILRSGGVLNVVDRSMLPTTPEWIEAVRQDNYGAHKEQASPTSLVVDPHIDSKRYVPPPSVGIQMGVTRGASGIVIPNAVPGLSSVVALKP